MSAQEKNPSPRWLRLAGIYLIVSVAFDIYFTGAVEARCPHFIEDGRNGYLGLYTPIVMPVMAIRMVFEGGACRSLERYAMDRQP